MRALWDGPVYDLVWLIQGPEVGLGTLSYVPGDRSEINSGTVLRLILKTSLQYFTNTVSYYAPTYFTLLLILAATATITPHIRKMHRVIGTPTFNISGKTS